MGMMPQPVQQGGGEFGIPEDLHPLAESEVRGDKGRPPLVPLRQQVEKQFSAGAVERHESQFIHDKQVCPFDPAVKPSQKSFVTGFKKRAH
jgi:hypothetical protein